MTEISIKAPAKINLSLDILDKRRDGYHNVRMVMQSVSLYDIITVTKKSGTEITISCNKAGVPLDNTNLVYKAAKAFFDAAGIAEQAVHIDIDKNIPVQAGLAGGSTDCAATLVAMKKLFASNIDDSALIEIGEKLGADVPFCFCGGTMLATGTGTTLSRLEPMPHCSILLVKPSINISTKEAYAKSDNRTTPVKDSSTAVIDAIKKGDEVLLANALYNDFESIIDSDKISNIKQQLTSAGAKGACMSGSGPTVFGIFDNKSSADRAFYTLKNRYTDVFTCVPVEFSMLHDL